MDPIAPLAPALRAVSRALTDNGVEHRVGGSVLLAAHGLADIVGDVDVTAPASTLHDVRQACARWSPRVDLGEAPPPWCSDWIVRCAVDSVEVEIIGGFCVRTADGSVTIPHDLGGTLEVGDTAVPLADLAVWWWIYRAYRPEKADRIAAVVPQARLDAVVARLGPVSPGDDGSNGTDPGSLRS